METRSGTDRGATYDPASAAPPEKASVVEDFIDIFPFPVGRIPKEARLVPCPFVTTRVVALLVVG